MTTARLRRIGPAVAALLVIAVVVSLVQDTRHAGPEPAFRELFVAGTVPGESERYYGRDADGRITIDPPPEARAWASDAGLLLRSDGRATADPLRIVSPIAGAILFLAPELAKQHLVLRAVAAPGIARVTFEIDGRVIGDAPSSDPSLLWTLEPGRHTLRASARQPGGAMASVTSTFEVKAR